MRLALTSASIALTVALSACGEVHERVLTPSIIADSGATHRISKRLQEADRVLFHEFVVAHRLARLDPERAPPVYRSGPKTVAQALDVSRRMRAIGEDCQARLSPIAARLADEMRASARNPVLMDALNANYRTVSDTCTRRRWAVQ